MVANKVADIFDETVDEVNSPNSTTHNNPKIKFSEATTVPIYPVEYIEKIVEENDQWKKLWKDSIFEARRVKAHMAERKAVTLQDSSFQK
nr:unnamed protein product [Callosobruchus chinensis]